jgi:hypothetical protein
MVVDTTFSYLPSDRNSYHSDRIFALMEILQNMSLAGYVCSLQTSRIAPFQAFARVVCTKMNLDQAPLPISFQFAKHRFDDDVYSLCQTQRTKIVHHHGQHAQPAAGSPPALMVARREKHALHLICRFPFQTQL